MFWPWVPDTGDGRVGLSNAAPEDGLWPWLAPTDAAVPADGQAPFDDAMPIDPQVLDTLFGGGHEPTLRESPDDRLLALALASLGDQESSEARWSWVGAAAVFAFARPRRDRDEDRRKPRLAKS
jgi:hypothetical protein